MKKSTRIIVILVSALISLIITLIGCVIAIHIRDKRESTNDNDVVYVDVENVPSNSSDNEFQESPDTIPAEESFVYTPGELFEGWDVSLGKVTDFNMWNKTGTLRHNMEIPEGSAYITLFDHNDYETANDAYEALTVLYEKPKVVDVDSWLFDHYFEDVQTMSIVIDDIKVVLALDANDYYIYIYEE